MTTTWNPADKAANITLTSTNHIASHDAGAQSGVRGTTSHNTGKWYLEYSAITSGQNIHLGLGTAAEAITGGTFTASVGVLAGSDTGTATIYDAFNSSSNSFVTGLASSVIALAVDLGTNKFWMRKGSGSWFGTTTGDPVAETNGVDISGRAAALFPFLALQDLGAVTINCGDSAFAQSVPSGYVGWDAPAALPVLRRPLVIF